MIIQKTVIDCDWQLPHVWLAESKIQIRYHCRPKHEMHDTPL